jgi:hypothetical protein
MYSFFSVHFIENLFNLKMGVKAFSMGNYNGGSINFGYKKESSNFANGSNYTPRNYKDNPLKIYYN